MCAAWLHGRSEGVIVQDAPTGKADHVPGREGRSLPRAAATSPRGDLSMWTRAKVICLPPSVPGRDQTRT